MIMQKSIALLICFACSYWFTPSDSCNITFGNNGTFSIAASSDVPWLISGPVAFMNEGKWITTADGSLEFLEDAANTSTGQDSIGSFTEYSYQYQAGNVTMVTSIKQYKSPAILILTQRFPQGVTGSRYEANKTMSSFPSFNVEHPATPLGYLSFGSFMFGDRIKKFGKWDKDVVINDGMDGSAPLLVFDKSGNALLISPFDNFMAASMWYDKVASILNWGVMGGVDLLPPGFELKTIAVCSNSGIGEVFADWGRVMRSAYKKTDDIINYHQSQDITLTRLGYWTDNGAYYYYYNPEPGKNLQDTLLDVKQWSIENHVPYRYLQLDSWFYPKDRLQAVTTWDAMESIFPRGINAFQDVLQMPLAAHNRYWSVNTTYAKQNGGLFDFVINQNLSLPIEGLFWDYLLGHGKEEWGLVLYEQDWLNVQTLFTEVLNTNLTIGRTWLTQMAQAALRRGVKIQYCMALSRHALQSLEFPVVTQARVSNDYLLSKDQWKIGITSHFAHAMGVAPSKDTFWTSQDQTGNKYGKQEAYPSLQTVVSVLSRGPVGPGDKINSTNVSMLKRCCDEDGLILKPSVPARALDDQFLEMAFQDGTGASGEVWSTYSTHLQRLYGIVLAASLSQDYDVSPQKAGFTSKYAPQFDQSTLYTIRDNEAVILDKAMNLSSHYIINASDCSTNGEPFCIFYTSPLLTVGTLYTIRDNEAVILDKAMNLSSHYIINASDCSTNGEPFCIFYTSPLLTVGEHTVSLLGDLTKWVPMSEERILHVWSKSNSLAVTLRGREGESISLSYILDDDNQTMSGVADGKGCLTFTLVNGTEPLHPSDLDCRFKEPPFTTISPHSTDSTDRPTTTHHGGGAQSMQTWPVFWLWIVAPLSYILSMRH